MKTQKRLNSLSKIFEDEFKKNIQCDFDLEFSVYNNIMIKF